jgi:thymidylate synthase (FAD)
MSHCVVPEADAILDKQFAVLDKGYVKLIDYMGGDNRVIQSARISYDSTALIDDEQERISFINNLMKNHHTSPFEQVVLTFYVKLPIFVARQWIRHRTARTNEMSGRYRVMKNDFYTPSIGLEDCYSRVEWCDLNGLFSDSQQVAYKIYTELMDHGIDREVARTVLPLSLYTEWYWQIDLHNLFHFLELRLNNKAQREIRLYAYVLLQLARFVAPHSCAAFERYILHAITFTLEEQIELHRRLYNKDTPSKLNAIETHQFESKLSCTPQGVISVDTDI